MLIIVALGLLLLSEKLQQTSALWFGRVLPSFASVIATSGVFAVVYELFIRRQQTRYVLEALDLRESMIRSGLDDVATNYMDYDYAGQIKNAQGITIFVLYAQTWISRYAPELNEFLRQPRHSLTLCVPAFDNAFLAPLAKQFGYTEDDLRHKIAESIGTFVLPAVHGDLGKGTLVRVYCHRSRSPYSAYKFDDRILVGTYYASSARRRAPMFEFIDVPGSMFTEFDADLKKVIDDESVLIFDSKDGRNQLREILGKHMPLSLKKVLDRQDSKSGVGESRDDVK